MGRKSPVSIYATAGYSSMLQSHLADFDITLSYELIFVPLSGKDPALILDDKYITVTSFTLKHRIPAFGFLFREKCPERNIIKEAITIYNIPGVRIPAIKKGEDFITEEGIVIRNEIITVPPPSPRSYAYCSDTKYFKRLSTFVKDVTLLYHEATFDSSKKDLASKTGHSTALDAAKTADDSGAGQLIIGHFSARYKDVGILLNEARSVFPKTLPAIDGMTYNIGDNSSG
jgi:ribonuclease Z